jgi:hypothetical protein
MGDPSTHMGAWDFVAFQPTQVVFLTLPFDHPAHAHVPEDK